MEHKDMVRKVDRIGRIGIPVKLRQEMNIEMCDDIEIFVEDENIVLRKVHAIKPCIITGEISDRNLGLANGELVLSPEGVRTLLKELKNIPLAVTASFYNAIILLLLMLTHIATYTIFICSLNDFGFDLTETNYIRIG